MLRDEERLSCLRRCVSFSRPSLPFLAPNINRNVQQLCMGYSSF